MTDRVSSSSVPQPMRGPASSVQSGPAWDKTISRLPHTHLLQSWAGGEFKAGYGWQARRLCWDSVNGPAAQVLRRTGLRVLRVLYVPKGPLLDWQNAPLRAQVLDELQALARRERAIFVKIDPDVVVSAGAPGPTAVR